MNKYDGVLKRVREVEYKKGIVYAKPDGKLYKTLRLIYTLVFAYTFFINLFFVWGMFLRVDASNVAMNDVFPDILTVSVCTFFAIVGLVLMYCKVHLFAGILNVIPLPVTLFVYAPLLKHDMAPLEGIFGYKESFYWKHVIPVVLLVILAVWMTVIAIRAKLISDRMYKKVVDDLFDIYKAEHKEEEMVSGSGWEDFLKNYDPDEHKSANKKAKKAKKLLNEEE